MKNQIYAAGITLSLALTGCASTTQTTASKSDSEKYQNNVVSRMQVNTTASEATATETEVEVSQISGSGGNDKVIFRGSHNLYKVISKNAAYFDKHHDVIIIEGDNNIIRLYNVNLVDMRGAGADTLILVGNKQKYVLDVSNTLALKKQPSQTSTILMQTEPYPVATLSSDFDNSEPMKNLLDNYREGLAVGDPDTYFRLAKMYHFGLDEDLEPSIKKAVDLYEYAAVKNHLEAIRSLGDIYANESLDFKPDKVKAIYYFTIGASLDDDYSKQRLQELRGK